MTKIFYYLTLLLCVTFSACRDNNVKLPVEAPQVIETVKAPVIEEKKVETPLFAVPELDDKISKKSKDLIIYYEFGSKAYFNKVTTHPVWPNTLASGVTVSGFYDCGYYSKVNIINDWIKIQKNWRNTLGDTSGIKGYAARDIVKNIKYITIPWDIGIETFDNVILGRYYQLALRTFPGMNELNADTRGVLLSLIMNRGASTSGESRREMRNIKSLVPKKDYVGIAREIKSMKRLWIGKGVDGLLKRRDSEADLVLQSIK